LAGVVADGVVGGRVFVGGVVECEEGPAMSEQDRVIARANWQMATQIYTDLIVSVSGTTAVTRAGGRRSGGLAVMLERAVNACYKAHAANPEIADCASSDGVVTYVDCDYRKEIARLYEAHLSAM
jgi:hypothetical protein